ncbi:MAG: glycosyltransferase family 4 protein [Candidatus Kapaibacteriota bacterium]|jgi:glycosyltransferase involved in cell wall biosynthesis
MKICFLVNLSGFGGLEIQTILRAKDCFDVGYKPIVVVRENTRSERFAKELKLPIENLKVVNSFEFTHLAQIFKRHSIDLCIVPKTNLLPIALLGRKFSNIKPKIIFYQQMQSGIRKKDPYHNLIYKNLDGAIVLTSIMAKMLIETTNIPPKKVFVVPYGVDWEKFQKEKPNKVENRKLFEIPENKFVIGCIGRVEPLKGQKTLLEAFAKANIPNSILVFAGTIDDQKYFKNLKEKAKSLKIAEQVIFNEFTFNVPKLMSVFDVFVMPSLSETFGLVLIEAMASSLPVISTNAGGVPEIVDDKINGFLFEPENSEQLSQILTLFYNDKDLANRLGVNALEKVKIKFDYQKNVSKFFEVCEEILFRK